MFLAWVVQGGVVVIEMLVATIWHGVGAGLATAYGSLVALTNVGLLLWRWRRGRYDYHCDGGRHLRSFHRSMLERFFVVVLLLTLGMGGLRFDPLPLLLGFIVGQLTWIFAAAVLKKN
jgi:ATP synthase protein I